MPNQAAIIFPSDANWSLGYLTAPGSGPVVHEIKTKENATVQDKAKAICDFAAAKHLRMNLPVLALPTNWCYAATVQTDGLIKRQRHEAMLFRLEEFLPLDAEELTGDFIEMGTSALGIAVQTQAICQIIDALEEEGIVVGPVCPTAFLAWQQITHPRTRQSTQLKTPDACLLQTEQTIDLLILDDGRPCQWYSTPAQTGDHAKLSLLLRQQVQNPNERLMVLGCSLDKQLERLVVDQIPNVDFAAGPVEPIDVLATLAAAQVVTGGIKPLVDLRRDQLAIKDRIAQIARPLQGALAAAMLLLLCICAACWWGNFQYGELTRQSQTRQETLFRQTFPGQNVPAAVVARVRSEERKLSGLAGQNDQLPTRISTLELLNDLLTRLPRDMRYRILEIRLDGRRLYIDGQARSHGDADLIAGKLRSSQRFIIEPPRTENLTDKGVAFTITGLPRTAESAPRSSARAGGSLP